jgi:hypothetical protein
MELSAISSLHSATKIWDFISYGDSEELTPWDPNLIRIGKPTLKSECGLQNAEFQVNKDTSTLRLFRFASQPFRSG